MTVNPNNHMEMKTGAILKFNLPQNVSNSTSEYVTIVCNTKKKKINSQIH